MTFDPIPRSRHFLKSNIVKTARLKDKVTTAQYGMVLCLVTLTDLQTRRAGLSASAELLVTQTVNDCINVAKLWAIIETAVLRRCRMLFTLGTSRQNEITSERKHFSI